MANGKVALATVPKAEKKAHIHHKSKTKKESNPSWEQFFLSWERLCLALLAVIVFILEFIPSGLEGACRSGLNILQRKNKL